MSRAKSVAGRWIGMAGPPMIGAAIAGLSGYAGDQKAWGWLGILALGAAIAQPGLAGLGRLIGEPSERDVALGKVLTLLLGELLTSTDPAVPKTPSVRATAFVPSKRDGKVVLVPCLRVHRSNMTKEPGYERADGKIGKGPGYEPPDVAGVLEGIK